MQKEVKCAKNAVALRKGKVESVPKAVSAVYLGLVFPGLFMRANACSLVFTVKHRMKSGYHYACYMIFLWLPSS